MRNILTRYSRLVLSAGFLTLSPVSGWSQPYLFSTLAGVGCGNADGTNSAARFFYPKSAALDIGGNLYVADSGNHTIRKITPAGLVSTFAGLAGIPGSADGTNSNARFNNPSGVAVDVSNNVYVADTGNHTIRMISPAGVVTTLAGLAGSYGSVDASNAAARFYHPIHLALDIAGNIYVADTFNHTIRKMRQDPRDGGWGVSTLAGQPGISGSTEGNGTNALLHHPWDVAVDTNGNIYVADAGNAVIRKITPLGDSSTLAGFAGNSGYADGTNGSARFTYPCAITVSAGVLYIADGGNFTIRRVTLAGVTTTMAGLPGWLGNSDGTGGNARFNHPCGLVGDDLGTLYVTDAGNNTIRKILPGGAVSTLAGLAAGSYGSANGTNTTARFNYLRSVAVDSAGNLYVADTGNHTIRKVTPAGAISTLAGLAGSIGSTNGTNGDARFWNPSGVALDAATNVYVADTGNHTIRKITPTGVVTTFAGLAGSPGATNGAIGIARFCNPTALAVDSATNIYVADFGNSIIRIISASGTVSTLAGLAGTSGSADGTNTTARFNLPCGIALDASSNVFVADTGNHAIRKVTPAGVVTTLAGLSGNPGGNDGTNSAARFAFPRGIVVDGASNLYVADTFGPSIRRITPAGFVTTVAGFPNSFGVADDAGPGAQFAGPSGLAMDGAGNLYVADTFNNSLRKGVVYNAPLLLADLQNQTVFGGTQVTLSVNATGALPLSYQWRKNGVILTNQTNATLILSSAGLADAANYDVIVSNSFGSVTSSIAALVVSVPPNDLFVNAFTLSGDTVVTTGVNAGAVKESGEPSHAGNTGGRSVWWQWTPASNVTVTLNTEGSTFDTLLAVYRGTSVTGLTSVISNDDYQGLSSRVVFAAKGGVTYLFAVDGYNGHTGAIVLNLVSAPPVPVSITAQPASHEDILGADVAFRVIADGSPPLKYRWRKNGVNISSATADTFTLSNITSNDAATYSVVVSNEFSTVTSSNVALTLTNGYSFTTLAGSPGYGFADGTGSAARFHTPNDVAVDNAGNAYIADGNNNAIRKVTPAGVVTTIAGLPGTPGSANGTGSNARFSVPAGICVDSATNIYVADSGNNNIRKITPAGVVTTLAGQAGTTGTTDATGTNARFASPASVGVDFFGNVYVADCDNHTIRKVTPAGVVTTWAGTAAVSGIADGQGTNASFNQPSGLAVDAFATIYVADTFNSTIRKITPLGLVSTLAGTALIHGYANGTGTNAEFHFPSGVSFDLAGDLYVTDGENNTIRKVTTAGGVVTTFAGLAPFPGSANGTNNTARFNNPSGVSVDFSGNLLVADTGNHTVRRITPAAVVTTLAGSVGHGYADGTGMFAQFDYPNSAAVDSGGITYVADYNNNVIRKVNQSGTVTTFAGLPGVAGSADGSATNARFYHPVGVALDLSSNLYVADSENHTIRKITQAGVVSTLAGLAGSGGSDDGQGTNAHFYYPEDVAVDSTGTVYVADAGTGTIRKITPGGLVSTLAGLPWTFGSADSASGIALFWDPRGITVDAAGNVYVADTRNHIIRKITPAGFVTTLAGRAGLDGTAGGTADAARFNFPYGIEADSAGNLYVADAGNHTVRLITTNGAVRTLGGLAGSPGAIDGTGTAAEFTSPRATAVDATGAVYVADAGNYSIRVGRKVLPPGPLLGISLTGNYVILLWPNTATGYVVQASGTPTLPASWQNVTNGTVTNVGSNFVLSNQMNGSPAFYRLFK